MNRNGLFYMSFAAEWRISRLCRIFISSPTFPAGLPNPNLASLVTWYMCRVRVCTASLGCSDHFVSGISAGRVRTGHRPAAFDRHREEPPFDASDDALGTRLISLEII
jgi:hypothetical protein